MSAPTTDRSRLSGDGGAVLVELALAMPLLVLLCVGVLEYGSAWNDATAAERALLTAGRVLSNEGNARQADQEALLALSAGLEPGTRSEVRKVIIYDATTNDVVPTSCKDASTSGSPPFGVAGTCNVYTGTQVETALSGSFTGANCVGGWDARFCPTTRVREPNPSRVGIYIEVHYAPVTGLLPPGGITIDRYVVYQLEPPTVGG